MMSRRGQHSARSFMLAATPVYFRVGDSSMERAAAGAYKALSFLAKDVV
jgi:hypothetical protein